MIPLSNISIVIIVGGIALFLVAAFLAIFGSQAPLSKRLTLVILASMYFFIMILITLCLHEKYWLTASVSSVRTRIWASDLEDQNATVSVKVGLRGLNVTLQSGDLDINEEFVWSWGTKVSIDDGQNPYTRTMVRSIRSGVPLPVQDIAEKFETYGPLGSASAGIGVHEAGFYTHLCLTIALASWVLVGFIAPLSLFASFYAGVITSISVIIALIIYLVIAYAMSVPLRASMRYIDAENESRYKVLQLKANWCTYMPVPVVFMLVYFNVSVRREAERHAAKILQKMRLEMEEANNANFQETEINEAQTNPWVKRRLTARKTYRETIEPVPLSALMTSGDDKQIVQPSDALKDKSIIECAVDYKGPDTMMFVKERTTVSQ